MEERSYSAALSPAAARSAKVRLAKIIGQLKTVARMLNESPRDMTSEMVDKDKDGMKDNKCMCGEDGKCMKDGMCTDGCMCMKDGMCTEKCMCMDGGCMKDGKCTDSCMCSKDNMDGKDTKQ